MLTMDYLLNAVQEQYTQRSRYNQPSKLIEISYDWWQELNRPTRILGISVQPVYFLVPGQVVVV